MSEPGSPRDPLGILERHARAGTWSLHVETERLWWSPGIFRLHGMAPDSTQPSLAQAVAFYEAQSRDRINAAIAHCLATGQGWDLTLEICRVDGSRRFVHAIGELSQRPGGAPLLAGVLIDVHRQTRERHARLSAERALSERSAQWRIAAANAGLGLVELDLDRDLYRISGGFASLLGPDESTEVELSRAQWRARIHPSDRDRWSQALTSYLDGYTPRLDVEYRVQLHDGRYIWVHGAASAASGDVGARDVSTVIGTISDISRRKADEIELREWRDRVQRTFDQAPIGVALVGIDGRWLEVNRALCDITGYAESELKASTFQQITHPDDLDIDLRMFNSLLSHHQQRYRLEKRYLHKDGHFIDIQLDTSLLVDDVGDPLYYISHIQDITQAKRDHRELFEAKERAEVTLDAIKEGVIRVDEHGIIREHNAAALALLRWADSTLTGLAFRQVIALADIDNDQPLADPVERVLSRGESSRGNVFEVLHRLDGSRLVVSQSVSPIRGEDASVVGAVFVFQDMTQARSAHQALVQEARRDPLTRLPNRRAFEQAVEQAWQAIQSGGPPVHVMYLDLDHFKDINDVCGHAVGDEVLERVARTVSTALGPHGLLARLGGDEFGALLHVENDAPVRARAAAAVDAVARLDIRHNGRLHRIGLSVGIAAMTADLATPDMALAHADTALYIAKRSGRGRHRMYSTDDRGVARAGRYVEAVRSLSEGVDGERFSLYCQRVVDSDERCLGYETMIRFIAPDASVLAPEQFMPTARRMGLLPEIDRWMLATLIESQVLSDPVVDDAPYFSVNLSIESIQDQTCRDALLRMLDRAMISPGRLIFEIVQKKDELSDAAGIAFVEALRARGFPVWIDDFTLTVEAYRLLGSVPVDGIKIDQQFVCEIGDPDVEAVLARSLAGMAAALSLSVVVKDIETVEVKERLAQAGFSRFQGHLFHRPESVDGIFNDIRAARSA